jgi:hypothetical protein
MCSIIFWLLDNVSIALLIWSYSLSENITKSFPCLWLSYVLGFLIPIFVSHLKKYTTFHFFDNLFPFCCQFYLRTKRWTLMDSKLDLSHCTKAHYNIARFTYVYYNSLPCIQTYSSLTKMVVLSNQERKMNPKNQLNSTESDEAIIFWSRFLFFG